MSEVVKTPAAQPLTIERVHTIANVAHRWGSFYHIKGEKLSLYVQGNAFSSCGINLLLGLSGLNYTSLRLLDPLLDMLKNFEDNSPGLSGWKAKRFLIQPHATAVRDYPFLKALLDKAVKISEYDNLAHHSCKQYLYMLSFE